MGTAKHLVIVIPAYNESRVIGEVLASLPKTLPGIGKITLLVVDDNSSDNTAAIIRDNGATCIHHEMNLGAGGATVTGIEAAKKLKADIVVTMDADGQHSPDDLCAVIRPILDREVDVVLGSRMKAQAKGMPWHKVIGNNLLNAVTFAFYRIWVSDSQSGYKAFSRKAVTMIELKTSGYELCSEIIGEIKNKKLRYTEVPISTIYTDYSKRKGQLALNAVNIILGILVSKIR